MSYKPMKIHPSLFFHTVFLSLLLKFCSALDILTSNATITNGKTLVSLGQSFELGFFSPSNSSKWYIGIWYKKFPEVIVWVANRENPLGNSSGVLTISPDGDLVLLNATTGVVWSSNSSRIEPASVAQLLESGNLVLKRKDDNTENHIWQSFDFPSDTLLPGMKMGWNLSTGANRYLTSWKGNSDPSPGDITYRIDHLGMPQFVLRKGSEKIFRTGPWNGIRFSGTGVPSNILFKVIFVYDKEDLYYKSEVSDDSIITRLAVNQSGLLQRLVLNKGDSSWTTLYSSQNDPCDEYGVCGANGICKISSRPICECLHGFVPKSKREWDVLRWWTGCVRRIPLSCHQGEGFVKLRSVKLPDLLQFSLNESLSLEECEAECWKNCNCIAYANSDIRKGSGGCFMWFGDLIDIREFSEDNEQDIYIRMPASELGHSKKTKLVLITGVSSLSGILILCFMLWCLIQKSKRKRASENKGKDIELPLFDLNIITTATRNFSLTNMIGEGGFGIVYKGTLSTGQQVAVKRLSKNSGQGIQEFKNEVMLIAKLQHRNLVRLLGCCFEGDERMLIYEYMPNKSLDYFIFDQDRKALLTWQKRFEVAMGISRGLLYLHQDSRLRIIHRDLKASNILLDCDLNPKISDFGIARSFDEDLTEIKTKRVIGTYGYMSPEYAVDGKYSVKSDVFSFGVLLLEIVSGKKNRSFHHPDHHHNLLGHAWLLFKEGKALELVEHISELSFVESQVLRCIHVSLLCVQKLSQDRPTMASVVVMLSKEGEALPQPKEPGFFVERSCTETETSTSGERRITQNGVTITVLEAR
ncbi:G-type lectin S-receptor-like serine/threonine-protein kinase At4g27290 isoform X1 [Olea europaea var. sylvestris]|uniref:G-type lectin S-receptor-like serine/threonine-protein kinase At4g27290 isoform X1 n=1 Tax=Olea europaea var. sylvestris TaxID=158386 RepID=UPI000C1D52A1|nr:G-type lectin S-receptor-like serine/threonine-protein kinase At4g27290 isoform X1 [Olea europaea var. sylvestris]